MTHVHPPPSPARFWLGMTQMFLVGMAIVLLVETGVSPATVVAASVATAVTVVCRWVIRSRR